MSYGTGRVFRRGRTWWIAYFVRGKERRESSGSVIKERATDLLKLKLGEVASGRLLTTKDPTLDDLIGAVQADHALNERKSTAPVARLLEHFGGEALVRDLDFNALTRYAAERKSRGASAATVRNELCVVGRGFTLLHQAGRLPNRPPMPRIRLSNARQGFIAQADLDRLLPHLREPLRAFVEVAYITGWRRSELVNLEWRRVSFEHGEMWLERGRTKNDEPRRFYFDEHPRLAELLNAQRERVERIQRERDFLVANVFVHDSGLPMRGWYYDQWSTACHAAGLDGLLVHDLRRSAVRNLVRSGVGESVAMRLTGHKTNATFKRYDITSGEDERAAVRKLAEHDWHAESSSRVLPMNRRAKG